MDTNFLLLECRSCRMKFETQREFDNHKQNFCKESEYGTLPSLYKKLEASDNQSAQNRYYQETLTLNDVDRFVQYQRIPEIDAQIKGTEMYDARASIKHIEDKFLRYNKEYENSHQKMIRDELNNINIERQKANIQRKQNEGTIEHLLKEVDNRKEKERAAINEKDEIEKALRELEKRRAEALEAIKKAEIQKILEEKQKILDKEAVLKRDISSLQEKAEKLENDPEFQSSDLITRTRDIKENYKQLKLDEISLYRNKGEDIAYIRRRKEMLENDRKKIMEDLDKLRNGGDVSAARKNKAGLMAAAYILNKHDQNDIYGARRGENSSNFGNLLKNSDFTIENSGRIQSLPTYDFGPSIRVLPDQEISDNRSIASKESFRTENPRKDSFKALSNLDFPTFKQNQAESIDPNLSSDASPHLYNSKSGFNQRSYPLDPSSYNYLQTSMDDSIIDLSNQKQPQERFYSGINDSSYIRNKSNDKPSSSSSALSNHFSENHFKTINKPKVEERPNLESVIQKRSKVNEELKQVKGRIQKMLKDINLDTSQQR
ncbi:unnamed protein product [Blepharisma stoltei]|uniref:C2H2-type domain-containing protein n=1 Tax=Blepharisma stoltei TaxID=1481888 RepID=A0AAU9K780_9CILI|nr:unnamed protein product [Blepharisma stoltei]